MKILFLNPPHIKDKKYIREGRCMQLTSSWATIWPPLTLMILASIAEEGGHKAEIFDANVEPLEFEAVDTLLEGVDVVVLNTAFPSIDSDLEVAKRIKKYNKAIIIISFGVYFTMLEEEAVPKDRSIDYSIIGEPEETFKELLVSLEKKTGQESIDGLMFFDKDGSLKKTAKRALIEDLDSLPKPNRSLINTEKYILPNNGETFTLINTSRGCPYSCTFCIVKVYYGRKIRRHSTEYILDEITECVDKYNIKNFLLWEEAFTLDRKVVNDFCNGLAERRLDIKWAVTTRADSLDIESLRLMKKMGCFLMGMGIETTSQKILDGAKKQQKIEDIERGIRLCKEVGLPVMGHFIFGLPGETKQTAEDTLKFIKKCDLDYI
ncbi:MAG: radical SAM protein [bacterium]